MFVTNAPPFWIWLISLILGVAGIVGHFAKVEYLTEYSYYLLMAGFILLVLATLLKRV